MNWYEKLIKILIKNTKNENITWTRDLYNENTYKANYEALGIQMDLTYFDIEGPQRVLFRATNTNNKTLYVVECSIDLMDELGNRIKKEETIYEMDKNNVLSIVEHWYLDEFGNKH